MDSLSYRELKKLARVYPPLSREEQELLAIRAAAGDRQAEEKLILHNVKRLLYFVEVFTPGGPGRRHIPESDFRLRAVNKWRKFAPRSITAEDILSAAQYALLKAVRTYKPLPGSGMDFNRYANLLIFREIQHLRERHEHMVPTAPPEPVPPETPTPEDDLPEAKPTPPEEKAMALILFEHYAEKALSPEERERLGRMLAGKEEADEAFLASVGRKLRQIVPAEDWAYLAAVLTGDQGPNGHVRR